MTLSPARAQEIAGVGVHALRRGDAKAARALFEQVAASGQAAPPLWRLLSEACRALGDRDAEEAAIDRVLAVQSNDLRALIAKGDCRLARGDDRSATSYFGLALKVAAASGPLPDEIAAEVRRVEGVVAALGARYQAFLDKRLALAGVSAEVAGRRFRQSLDIMTGGTTVYFQEPSSFFFPGLPQIQFYEREDFAWIAEVESAVPAMQAELHAILAADEAAFAPYVEHVPGRPAPVNPLLGDRKWSAFYLWKSGAPVAGNAERCPATMAALTKAPVPHIRTRSPMALFSRLLPGTHIPPHNGLLNTRLICHIPLIVPPGCRFRVGNEVREWEEGRALIFDDSIEHEAWNDGAEERVVLLFEVWRPELTAGERSALTTLFEAINDYGETPGDAAP